MLSMRHDMGCEWGAERSRRVKRGCSVIELYMEALEEPMGDVVRIHLGQVEFQSL